MKFNLSSLPVLLYLYKITHFINIHNSAAIKAVLRLSWLQKRRKRVQKFLILRTDIKIYFHVIRSETVTRIPHIRNVKSGNQLPKLAQNSLINPQTLNNMNRNIKKWFCNVGEGSKQKKTKCITASFFTRVRTLRKATISFVMSVRLSAWNN